VAKSSRSLCPSVVGLSYSQYLGCTSSVQVLVLVTRVFATSLQ